MTTFLGLIDENGNYYEAEHNITGATEVSKRPSPYHDWVDGTWVERTEERLNAERSKIRADLTSAVQVHLDETAKSSGYDNIVSACSYAGAANPFQAEGSAFVVWRGAVWAACYAILAEVEAGSRAIPSAVELLTALPVLSLPE